MKQSLLQRLLFFRFLGFLKSRHPKLFYFCLLLTAVQLLCTVAKLEITPFMLYGMFSEKYPPTATFSRHQIVLDGQPLYRLQLPLREQMFWETSVENYLNQWQNGNTDPLQTRIESRYPFFTNSAFYPYFAQHIYNRPEQTGRFELWFKKRASTATGRPVQQVTILRETYAIRPYSAPIKLVRIDTIRQF